MRFSLSAAAGAQQRRIAASNSGCGWRRPLRGRAVAGGGEVIAEREPRLRQVGLERDRAAQRRERLVAAAEPPQRDAQLQVGPRRVRLRDGKRFEDLERA